MHVLVVLFDFHVLENLFDRLVLRFRHASKREDGKSGDKRGENQESVLTEHILKSSSSHPHHHYQKCLLTFIQRNVTVTSVFAAQLLITATELAAPRAFDGKISLT